jgi:hypothetical protein
LDLVPERDLKQFAQFVTDRFWREADIRQIAHVG